MFPHLVVELGVKSLLAINMCPKIVTYVTRMFPYGEQVKKTSFLKVV